MNWFIDKAGGHLSIKDNGIGMEESILIESLSVSIELTKDGQENWWYGPWIGHCQICIAST